MTETADRTGIRRGALWITDRTGIGRGALWVTTAAAVLPMLVVSVRAVLRGWRPTGDLSYMTLNADQVLSRHPPLLGTWSSASQNAGRHFNHPGPLLFDLLALPVEILGQAAGTAIGMALVNVAAVLVLVALVRRRFGPRAAALAAALCALLAWSMGSDILFNVWNPYAVLWAFAAFLVAAWCVAGGDLVAAPAMVVTGSLVLQTHLSYSVLVPGLTVVALACAVAAKLARKAPENGRVGAKFALITLATALLVWAPPLWEQLVSPEGEEGNLTLLARSADVESRHPTFEQAVGALGGTVALPPAWLAPSFGDPRYGFFEVPPPLSQAGPALVTLAVALGVLGWRAFRRGSTAVAAGSVTALAALVLAMVTLLRMPLTYGMQTAYGRFMWPLGMVVWLVLGLGVVDELRARGWLGPDHRRRVDAGQALAAVVAVVGGIAALPTVDHGSQPAWTLDAVDSIEDDLLAAIDDAGGGPVVVNAPYHNTTGYLGPPVLAMLEDAGIDFFVYNAVWSRQFGTHHALEDGDHPRLALSVMGGPFAAGPVDGARRVAYWSRLGPADQADYEAITADLVDIVAAQGIVLTASGRQALEDYGDAEQQEQVAAAADDAEEAVSGSPLLLELARATTLDGSPMLDPDVFDPGTLRRWVRLGESQQFQVGLWLERLP